MTDTFSWQARLATRDPNLHVHLIGIGGAGLAPLATVLHEQGLHVSGSDVQANPRTERLAAAGVQVFPRQEADNLLRLSAAERPDVVLISSAVTPANGERRTAQQLGLPVVKRRQFLGPLLADRQVIAVAGTHGKSTTTAMIVLALHENGVDAGYIIGSELPRYGSAHAGRSPYFVIEADEYDRMFLGLNAHVAVVTNVEWDHPDCYPTPASFRRAFAQFTDQVRRGGAVISCGDDAGAEALRAYAPTRRAWLTYGVGAAVDVRAVAPKVGPAGGYSAEIRWRGAPCGRLRLQTPGLHNLRNALAAFAAARACDIPAPEALAALGRYRGIARRFEWKGEENGVTVIDDYAHHPTEIAATLAAARQRFGARRLWAVFQPHTFSRTRKMLHAMAQSFGDADRVIVTDIYAAREKDDGTVQALDIVRASPHPAVQYIAGLETVADYLAPQMEPGDVVLTLGAGTSVRIGELLLERLRRGA